MDSLEYRVNVTRKNSNEIVQSYIVVGYQRSLESMEDLKTKLSPKYYDFSLNVFT